LYITTHQSASIQYLLFGNPSILPAINQGTEIVSADRASYSCPRCRYSLARSIRISKHRLVSAPAINSTTPPNSNRQHAGHVRAGDKYQSLIPPLHNGDVDRCEYHGEALIGCAALGSCRHFRTIRAAYEWHATSSTGQYSRAIETGKLAQL